MRIAILSDGHFHPPGVPTQAAYDSDASFNDRNRAVVELVNRAQPDRVIHLGDLPHPVPGLAEHAAALAVARSILGALQAPLHVVPGNHDLGDKPHPLSPAPRTGPELHEAFEAFWGPPWWSVDHDDCRLIGIDTPILNTGLDLEKRQWAWLEEVLATDRRVFAFAHYPPFLHKPDEPEHYDNLGEPGRRLLLQMLSDAGVKALFTGHVHHFFAARHRGMELITAPSTTFVRPGYAEVVRVAPEGEYGRNDAGRLGFLMLHIDEDAHRYEPIRSAGRVDPGSAVLGGPAPDCPLGLTFRYPWAAPVDIPVGNLDPFVRKRVRNDLLIWSAWDLGVRQIRLPISDLLDDESFERLPMLTRAGATLVFFHPGVPRPDVAERIAERAEWVHALELILPRPLDPHALDALPEAFPQIWLSVVGGRTQAGYFSHFQAPGFDAADRGLEALPSRASGLTHLVGDQESPWEIVKRVSEDERKAIVHVRMPRAGESAMFDDDAALANRVAEAWAAAVAFPQVAVFLDGFVDHDRGYHPRIGLVDRRMDPRPAYDILRELSARFGGRAHVTREDDGFGVGDGRLVLGPGGPSIQGRVGSASSSVNP